jgi:hypothetical protein
MRALLLAALVVLSGCAAVGPGGTASPTASPIPTPTGPCEVDDRPMPDAGGGDVAPESYPERPDNRTAEAVGAFVASFEETYIQNAALVGQNVTYIETYTNDVNVSVHGDAYVVRLTSYNNGAYTDTDEETPVEVHWDGAPEPVTYLVTNDSVLRGEGDLSPDRLRHQPTVACL